MKEQNSDTMEKFKPEYLTTYLPYSLKVMMEGKKTNVAWMSTKNIAVIRPDSIGDVKRINWDHAHLNINPILHPLSRVAEPILPENERPIDIINEIDEGWTFENGVFRNERYKPNQNFWITPSLPQWLIESLSSWHIDWQGLIEKGLAIEKPLNK